MAITNIHKDIAEGMLVYYSWRVGGVPQDKANTESFLYGDETTKVNLIKEFVGNILLPKMQVDRTNLSNNLTELDNKIAELQNIIK